MNNWSPHHGNYYSYLKMNKLCLIFLGVLAIAAIVSAWDNEEDSSLSEELAPSRLLRSADARRRKGKKARKRKEGMNEKRKKGMKGNKGGDEWKKNGRKSQSGSRSSGESRQRQSNVLQGEHCQFIDFANARSSGSGCVDGTKMVVKNK